MNRSSPFTILKNLLTFLTLIHKFFSWIRVTWHILSCKLFQITSADPEKKKKTILHASRFRNLKTNKEKISSITLGYFNGPLRHSTNNK